MNVDRKELPAIPAQERRRNVNGWARLALVLIFALAILIRVIVTVHVRPFDRPDEQQHWNFAYEAGRLAYSLATGQGYSSPMPEPTGPSAFLAPAFPFLLSCVFRIFGVYTEASAVVILGLDIVLSAGTCIVLYLLGRRLFGTTAGVVAALALAIYPPSIFQASTNLFDPSLSTLALTVLMYAAFRLPESPSMPDLILLGALMGAVIYVNPAPGIFYPAIVLWVWLRFRRSGRTTGTALKGAVALCVACWIVFLPWMIRNWFRVGEFTPRSSSGVQFMLGNNEQSWERHGMWNQDIYPSTSHDEMLLFQRLGEKGYDAYCAERAMNFIRQNPRKFVDLVRFRITEWWTGSASADEKGRLAVPFEVMTVGLMCAAAIGFVFAFQAKKPVGLLLALVLVYPLPYYIFVMEDRYRLPVDSILLMFGAFACVELWRRFSSRHSSAGSA